MPPRVAAAIVRANGTQATVTPRDGVLATGMPGDARWRDSGNVGIRYVAAPDAPRVAVLDLGRAGGAVRQQLRRRAFRTAVGGPTERRPARTVVRFAPGHRADAEAVRRVLRVHDVAAASRGPGGADVDVVVGKDLVSRLR